MGFFLLRGNKSGVSEGARSEKKKQGWVLHEFLAGKGVVMTKKARKLYDQCKNQLTPQVLAIKISRRPSSF